MSDRSEERHQELLNGIRELHKRQLLDLMLRLERLESTESSEILLTRLPSIETDEQRESVIIEMKQRLTALESRYGDED